MRRSSEGDQPICEGRPPSRSLVASLGGGEPLPLLDDQRQRDAERGHAQRRCRFEARRSSVGGNKPGLGDCPFRIDAATHLDSVRARGTTMAGLDRERVAGSANRQQRGGASRRPPRPCRVPSHPRKGGVAARTARYASRTRSRCGPRVPDRGKPVVRRRRRGPLLRIHWDRRRRRCAGDRVHSEALARTAAPATPSGQSERSVAHGFRCRTGSVSAKVIRSRWARAAGTRSAGHPRTPSAPGR